MSRQGALNDRQRRFCELLASGLSQAEAYRQAGYTSEGAHRLAPRLAAKPAVAEYLAQLRADSKTATTLQLQEKREFLARVIRTPVGAVDEHSDLCQEKTVRFDGPDCRVEKIKMMSKAEAIRLDNQLAGHGVQGGPSVSIQNNVIPETVHRTDEENDLFLERQARILKKLGLVRVADDKAFPNRN